MGFGMKFREAQQQDLPQLLSLEQAIIAAERPFNPLIKHQTTHYYDINAMLNNDNVCLLVAEMDTDIVATGYARIESSKTSLTHDKHAYLGFMYVKPEQRGQGLNKRIIDQLILWSKQQNVYHFYLDVYAGNESAIKAYEKVGFKPALLEMNLSL